MEEKKLFEDSDEFLVKQIENILKENDTPYVKRYEGAGSSENFEKAQNAIQVFNEQDFEEEEIPEELKQTQEDIDDELKANKKYGVPKKILKTFIVLNLGVFIIALIIRFIIMLVGVIALLW